MAAILVALAGACYGVAFATKAGAPAVLPAIVGVCLLGRMATARQAFYSGLAAGLTMYVPHLLFFWSVFGPPAVALWVIAAMPMAIFVLLLNFTNRRLGPTWLVWLTPVFWTGVEYFRSELYYFRFAWLLPGQAAAFLPGVWLGRFGVYGLGFAFAAAAAMAIDRRTAVRAIGVLAAMGLATMVYVPGSSPPTPDAGLHVAGVQLEFPEPQHAADALDQLAKSHPEARILVLSEYTFPGPVPQVVRDVITKRGRYLVAGGMKRLPGGKFFDTAFVVGPDGRDVFEQGKSVPVQCMDDGLPAPNRRVWESPWGKIGIAVCYDLSYARVMDDFVRQGAQGLIIPTMDVAHWGAYERRMLHGRMAPCRSAEYGIPTFGVWNSGVSQLTDRFGRVIATAGYPGQGEEITGPFDLGAAGRVPPDRWLALAASTATGAFIVIILIITVIGRRRS